MAAGDLITGDYQFELRGLLMGEGTSYRMRRGSPQGLGVPDTKTQDTALAHAHGSVGGRDHLGVRTLTFELFVTQPDADAAWALLPPVIEAWAPSSTDLPLHFRVPGLGHLSVSGRPRGLVVNSEMVVAGRLDMLATFVALDPTVHSIPDEES